MTFLFSVYVVFTSISYLRSEGKYLLWRSHRICMLPHFSTFYLYSIHLNLTFTELSLARDLLSFLDLSDAAAQGQGWYKPAVWLMFPDCITVTITLPCQISFLFIFKSWQIMLCGLLPSICGQSWPASCAECGISFLYQKCWQGVLLCWFHFFFYLIPSFTLPSHAAVNPLKLPSCLQMTNVGWRCMHKSPFGKRWGLVFSGGGLAVP